MTSLTGEFQTDLSLDEAMDACAEAMDGLGWRIDSVEASRIIAHPDSGQDAPRIEIALLESEAGEATEIRITGSDGDVSPIDKDELVAELGRARDAIQDSIERTSEASEQRGNAASAPPPPAGWYRDSDDRASLRYWDGQSWTDQTHQAPVEIPTQPAPAIQESRTERPGGGAASATRTAKPTPKGGFPRPHWRKMTWALIIWSALILIWAIGGAASNECANETTQLNQDACEAGTGIGVALVLFIGFIGFVFFALIWFMTRPRGRECPACGEHVRKGQTACSRCGYDFAAAATGMRAAPS